MVLWLLSFHFIYWGLVTEKDGFWSFSFVMLRNTLMSLRRKSFPKEGSEDRFHLYSSPTLSAIARLLPRVTWEASLKGCLPF